MPELRLRVSDSYDHVDMIARYDGHTTIGQLADELERTNDRAGDRPRTIRRISRGTLDFGRDAKIAQSDLRSGDEVSLSMDSGVRDRNADTALANLRVTQGPDAGRTFELRRGESSIGRSSKNELVLNDDMASRRHAVFRVSDIVEVADAGSTNGVLVNDELISGIRRLRPGDTVQVGDTTLLVDLLAGHHEAVVVSDNAVEFNRPPRIERPFEPIKVVLANPVEPMRKPRIPLISALVPLVMGGVMYLATNSWITVIFLGMSPLLVLGNFIETKRASRSEHADALAEYEATLHDQRIELDAARAEEIRSRHRFSPSNDELLTCVADLSPRLWERELEHLDFLDLRVGMREQESRIVVEMPTGGKRDQRRELRQIVDDYKTLPPVPMSISGRQRSPIGIAGPAHEANSLARSLILQSATLHSPDELVIGALIDEGRRDQWDWLKWLPHCSDAGGTELSSPLVVGSDDGVEWLVAFQQLIENRVAQERSDSGDNPSFHPHLLLLVDSRVGVERSRMSTLLESGHLAGVSVLWLTEDARQVPNACRTVLLVEPGGASVTVGDSVEGTEVGGVPLEPMGLDAAETVARAMAPIVDVSADRLDGNDLPGVVSLIELVGGVEVLEDPRTLQLNWISSQESKALFAPVGAYEGGTLSIDIRVDGPHGLVGGTTGAGKSEFLQSYLAGLALNHSPQRINFLLVDYKGGSAFGELVDQYDEQGKLEWRGLRHTVGMITDLTPALVQRALVSLQAEVHRREMILNEHRAKDLAEMEKRKIAGTPPNLLIVVDEFAALAKEVPAFVDGVVDIAQRGRSLGLHLLLATQKPGGVVTPNIQANTNLRVALRMATEDESQDVVRSPIAGRIDRTTPGRGVMRRGPTDLVAFQSAYVGGVTTPTSAATLELGEFAIGDTRWITTQKGPQVDPHAESDLKRIVRAVNESADAARTGSPRRPWLDPLPSIVNLLDLPRPATDEAIPIGLADIPERQSRKVAEFRPDDEGSLLIFGMGGTGKTLALRSLATAFGLTKDRSLVEVHGLDFAGRGLEMLAPLPHVGSIIPSDDHPRVQRLIEDLEGHIAHRAKLFAAARASNLTEYRSASRGEPLSRVVVLVDGYDNFQAIYERIDRGKWIEKFPRIVADGRQLGIHFLLTGTRRSSFPMALASQVSARLVMRMASDDDYHAVGVDPLSFDDTSPPGRMRIGNTEVQGALVGHDASTAAESRAIEQLGDALRPTTTPAKPIRVLPETALRSDQRPTNAVRWMLTKHFEVVGPTFERNVLIAGPPRSGKTTALASLFEAAKECSRTAQVYAYAPSALLPTAGSFDDLLARLDSDEDGLIFVDDAERLAGTQLEFKMQQIVGDDRFRLVVAADALTARGYDPTFKTLRSRCDACVLQPNPDADGELLGAPIERSSRLFPPGRALVRLGDTVHLAQTLQ